MKKIYVVGLGPGAGKQMTGEAYTALEQSEVIVGYPVYLDLIRDTFPDKIYKSTPMKQEVERCHMAFMEAMQEKTTAMVCSGDAGVYGMAGLMLQISSKFPEVEVEIIPGITAAIGGAAVLGAPLMHDFAVISLSDLMTPWELIQKRLAAAASADMAICLYNPSSKKRRDYLNKACRIVMQYASPETVCGIVKQIGREGESCQVMTLQELSNYEADMFTTVFIGNSTTKVINGKMVTPRGYKLSE